MVLRQAQRSATKIKMEIQGPSGSGKTMGALRLAYGITGDWSKIAVIDTENGSADLYSHLGEYNVLTLTPEFSPEKYVQAIQTCEKAGIEVCIIDSTTHAWENLLAYHASLPGNSFANWGKVKPRAKKMLDTILQSQMHIISTTRVKQDYVLNVKNGKNVPEKVGLKSVQMEGVDYEYTIVFDLDLNHNAKSSKDRTELFMDRPEFQLNEEVGKEIKNWCNNGISKEDVLNKINKANSIENLKVIYAQFPGFQKELSVEFKAKIKELSDEAALQASAN